ncbi:hypothetical protein ABIE58_000026 [Roseovarius sp. MBR-78]|jgi:hypothetical protein
MPQAGGGVNRGFSTPERHAIGAAITPRGAFPGGITLI